MTAEYTDHYHHLAESIFILCSLAVIFVDLNHSYFDGSFLNLLQSYLPHWRYRNIRHNSYTCLFALAACMIYHSIMTKCTFDLEIFRITCITVVIFMSFWIQSIARLPNVSDQSVDTNTSVGRYRLSRFRLFPNSSAFSSGSQSEVNIEDELNSVYVEAFRVHYDEEEVPQERLEAAIRYLNTREGGIQAHRSSEQLGSALEHIESMNSRMDDSGIIQEYTYKELHHILVEGGLYRFEDFERVLEEHLNTNDFLPSPKEFVDLEHNMKGIVQLEEEVAERTREVAERTREVAERTREVAERTRALETTKQQVEKTEQQVVESRHKNLSLRERLRKQQQQHEEALQQKTERLERLLQMQRQRVWQLEQNPEGELQRLLQENERLKEENRGLWAKVQHTICSVCWIEEVQVSFLPCGHKVTCIGCVDTLPGGKCPMCMENIQDTESV